MPTGDRRRREQQLKLLAVAASEAAEAGGAFRREQAALQAAREAQWQEQHKKPRAKPPAHKERHDFAVTAAGLEELPHELWPAEAWPVSAMVREEMEARGYPELVLVRLMQRPVETWRLADMQEAPLSLPTALRLERALGIPAQTFMNYDRAYLDCLWSGRYEKAEDGHLVKKP